MCKFSKLQHCLSASNGQLRTISLSVKILIVHIICTAISSYNSGLYNFLSLRCLHQNNGYWFHLCFICIDNTKHQQGWVKLHLRTLKLWAKLSHQPCIGIQSTKWGTSAQPPPPSQVLSFSVLSLQWSNSKVIGDYKMIMSAVCESLQLAGMHIRWLPTVLHIAGSSIHSVQM